MSDPFAITQKEKLKYQEQFKALQPQNGVVTGAQAKGFFLQSQLPPLVLGQIWALADTDSDGRMDIKEFSMACKLINLKLRGFELPKTLPPVMLASLSSNAGTPILTPTGSMSPQIPQVAPVPAGGIPVLPTAPQVMNNAMIPTAVVAGVPQQPQMVTMQHGGQPIVGTVPPMVTPSIVPPAVPPPPIAAIQKIISPPTTIAPATAAVVTPVVSPAPIITPPHSTSQSRSHSISDRAPSLESPNVEWAIKGPTKLKYTQLFNTTDRSRSGYLTGVQARQILVQSKLPQATLAQIWALSDMDSDGRLGCEEFVLAMYLCDRAIAGEKPPVTLPPDLIPPSFRKVQSRHGSVSSVVAGSRHGSVSSRHASISSQGASDVADPAAGLPHQTSFEDKRKENFDKGQAELDRRRKLLMDQQKKEIEERERKEREEADKREKARLEAERKEQEELERQLQQQRELELEKEEQRKRALEAKEKARQELEKQRQLEWEKQRIAEMNAQKMREQEKVLKLKAQNQTLSVELSTLTEKIRELSQNICDTRAGVTNVKTVIDGMRTTRDTQMTEMSQLKAQIKEQNAKLLQLTQEKAKWDAKMKSSAPTDASQQEQMNAAFANKQLIINQLKDKIENAKQQLETRHNDISSNNIQLTEVKSELQELIDKCQELYNEYDDLRTQVLEIKHNRKNEAYSAVSAWDTSAAPTSAWGEETTTSVVTSQTVEPEGTTPEGFTKYRAVFDFTARNADEITFKPGDIILVPHEQNADPGWLAGEINGHTGWFPETYAEKIFDTDTPSNIYPTQDTYNTDDTYNDNNQQYISSTIQPQENVEEPVQVQTDVALEADSNGDFGYYIAAYPYDSAEPGDLNFQAGEMIIVTKKEGDWWTGTIGERTGMFPCNYVTKTEVGQMTPASAATTTAGDEQPAFDYSYQKDNLNNGVALTDTTSVSSTLPQTDESATQQEELDTEVSQITTQQKNASASQVESQGSFSRPMSRTSSITPGMRARKSEIAQAIAPYEATSSEQLTLTRGTLIMIRKKTESGWWEGEIHAKGRKRQIGWFPASYVKILQGGRNSGRNTPVSGSRIEMTETILDKVIALYPYKAQNDDELSFEKDDIIAVLGREEPEWWRGELNGLTGLFPSNYVGPFVTSGTKKGLP